jgi:hypothetical protein
MDDAGGRVALMARACGYGDAMQSGKLRASALFLALGDNPQRILGQGVLQRQSRDSVRL